MSHLNKIKYLIFFLFLCLFIPKVHAIVKPTNDFYVNDYANIISSDVKDYIMKQSVALEKVDGTQIVVVTVNDLEGLSIETYANKLFNDFGIGDKEKNNGLLLLLALEERLFRVEVGYGLEGILPDGKTGRFQDDYIIPYLKNDDFSKGIKNGYDAFFEEIVKQNNLNLDYDAPEKADNIFMTFLMPFLLMAGVIVGSTIRLKFERNKSKLSLILWLAFTIIGSYALLIIIKFIYVYIFMFGIIMGLFFTSMSGFRLGGSGYSRGSSGGFSGGGHFGGGGHSGGGGSTRGF